MRCRSSEPRWSRAVTRRFVLGLAGLGLAAGLLAGCGGDETWHGTDITGSSPALELRMTRARDGREVTAADYRGKVVLLYFGYTYCPDVCPLTLSNIASVLDRLGTEADADADADADKVRVLFVTVDPTRDTLPILAAYAANFAPQIEALRGTEDQIAVLARRYRIAYSVAPETEDHPYEVSHSSAVYAFDGSGAARVLYASLAGAEPDIAGIAADLARLTGEAPSDSLVGRLLKMF